MKRVFATLITTALLFGVGVGYADPTALDRGAALLAPFKLRLKEALTAGLAEGPVEAIGACRVEAPAIASELSRGGVGVGRASDRLRNPENLAPDWVAPVLAAYLADPSSQDPQALSVSKGRAGYVEPILVQPLCLTCHGKSLAPELSQRIRELYPEDRAVGYEVGDLRGVFWAEFPASE